MSIHRIPDRYLNTTLNIYREAQTVDAIGDIDTSQAIAYASIKANIQIQVSTTEFDLHGRVHLQDHVAYLNRIEESVERDIHIGDIAEDEKTHVKYLVLGIERWEAANPAITDSHHLSLILKAASGIPKEQLLKTKNVTSKAKIV